MVELDYCMSKVCSRDLWDKFGLFYADYFASDRIYRMKAFFARFASGESEGVDVFGVSWKEGSGLFHPPEGLISRVVRKVEKERAKGVLVAPDGLGSSRLAMGGGEGSNEEVDFGEQCVFGVGVSIRDCVKYIQRGPEFNVKIYVFNL